MKHNYALGIKKIIILWIVVFLGGYVLNSFFKKINSLDEGLYTRSLKIPRGFRVDFNRGGEVYEARLRNRNFARGRGIGNVPVRQIKVSMIANQTPAPASVSGLPNALGCAGPRFGLTGKQMYPKMNNAKPFIHGGSFSSFWFRKLSKSECQMFKRGIDCTSKPQDYVASSYLPNGYTKGDNGVLPVVSESKHGMGCVAYYVSNGQGTGRRVVWNTGCKPSSIRGGVCTVGKGKYASGVSGTAGAHTVLWSFPRRKDTGRGARAKGQGVWHPSLPSQVAKGNNLSNWDEFGIPIEAGDGIPRKKKAPPPPKPKAYSGTLIYGQANYKGKVLRIYGSSVGKGFATYTILQHKPAGSGPTAQKWNQALFPSSWKIAKGQTVFFRVRDTYGGTNAAIHILWMLRGTVPDATKTPGFANVVKKWNYLKRLGQNCWMDMNLVKHTSNTLTPAESAVAGDGRQFLGNNRPGTGSLRAGVAADKSFSSARQWINQ